eukprot:975307-Pyramimonas_sp.AAC.1
MPVLPTSPQQWAGRLTARTRSATRARSRSRARATSAWFMTEWGPQASCTARSCAMTGPSPCNARRAEERRAFLILLCSLIKTDGVSLPRPRGRLGRLLKVFLAESGRRRGSMPRPRFSGPSARPPSRQGGRIPEMASAQWRSTLLLVGLLCPTYLRPDLGARGWNNEVLVALGRLRATGTSSHLPSKPLVGTVSCEAGPARLTVQSHVVSAEDAC